MIKFIPVTNDHVHINDVRKIVEDHVEVQSKLEKENARLNKIIAQEASENDELGAEFVLVNSQRETIKKLKAHIANMSCCCAGCTKHNDELNKEENGLDI